MTILLSSNTLAIALMAAVPDGLPDGEQPNQARVERQAISSRLKELRNTPKQEKLADNPVRSLVGRAMRSADVTVAQFEEDLNPGAGTDPDKPSTGRPLGQRARNAIPIGNSGKSPRADELPAEVPTATGSLLTVVSSLVIVLGLFLCVIWISRRGWSRRHYLVPKDVIDIMGRAPLAARQNLHVIKFANKLLLVAVTPEGAETLTEITDPDEILRVKALCEQMHPGSNTSSFREVLSGFGSESGRSKLFDEMENRITVRGEQQD